MAVENKRCVVSRPASRREDTNMVSCEENDDHVVQTKQMAREFGVSDERLSV